MTLSRYGDVEVQSTIALERRIHRQKLAESKRRKKEAAAAQTESQQQAADGRLDSNGEQHDSEDVNAARVDDLSDNEGGRTGSGHEGGSQTIADISMTDGD